MDESTQVISSELREAREAARGAVIAYRGQFEQSVSVSRGMSAPLDEELIKVVIRKFGDLEARAEKAATETELEQIEDEAAISYRLRAYTFALPEIPIQGASVLSNMEQWTLPASALEILKKEVVSELKSTDLQKSRAALHALFKEYDEWSEYQDNYNREMSRLTWWLTGGIAGSLSLALTCLSHGFVSFGVAFAGITGSCVSVISKIPSVIVSGDSAPYHRSAIRRLATGFVASMVGVGVLLSGMVPISLPGGETFQDIIAGLSGASASSTKSLSNIIQVFEALAIVTLLGISERALTTFDEKIFQAKDPKS